MNEFSMAIAGLQTATKIAKAFVDLKIDSAVTDKAIELQGTIVSLQQQLLLIQEKMKSLSDAKDEIERRLMEYEKWDVTESQYDLKRLVFGGSVRMSNANHPSPKDLHWLCPNCFEKRSKSFLQPTYDKGIYWYHCPECSIEFRFNSEELYPRPSDPTP
jgi:hypothetical protein